jgi:hypothetical protein
MGGYRLLLYFEANLRGVRGAAVPPCGTAFFSEAAVGSADTAFGAASDESRVPVHNAGPSWGRGFGTAAELASSAGSLVARNLHGCTGASAGAQEAHENTSL